MPIEVLEQDETFNICIKTDCTELLLCFDATPQEWTTDCIAAALAAIFVEVTRPSVLAGIAEVILQKREKRKRDGA